MQTIQLYTGQVTVVDDDMFEMLGHLRWRFHPNGYAIHWDLFSDGKSRNIYLHRIVALARPGEQVHHIDGDKLNNLRKNLETMSPSDHHRNHRAKEGPRRNKYRGVCWDSRPGNMTRRWKAQICYLNKHVFLGRYATAEEAACAWDEAALRYFGPGCFQNFPDHKSPL